MNWKSKERATPAARETLSYTGSGKVSVSVNSIVSSPKVQRQVSSVREIAASQAAAKRK
jgi:hypothetical protein